MIVDITDTYIKIMSCKLKFLENPNQKLFFIYKVTVLRIFKNLMYN